MRPAGLYGFAPFVMLVVASAALFGLVAIGVSTCVWIPVGIGIAVYITVVTFQFLDLWNEYTRIRSKYTDDEANHFNRTATNLERGHGIMMGFVLTIFMFIRYIF